MLYEKAYRLAKSAHEGQVDKAGADYFGHPVAVASMVRGEDEKVVALLHDVIEDTDVKESDLRPVFGNIITDAVVALTHAKGEPYMEYIARVACNPLAKVVKLADLRHNMDLSRLSVVTEKDINRVSNKYLPALRYLIAL